MDLLPKRFSVPPSFLALAWAKSDFGLALWEGRLALNTLDAKEDGSNPE